MSDIYLRNLTLCTADSKTARPLCRIKSQSILQSKYQDPRFGSPHGILDIGFWVLKTKSADKYNVEPVLTSTPSTTIEFCNPVELDSWVKWTRDPNWAVSSFDFSMRLRRVPWRTDPDQWKAGRRHLCVSFLYHQIWISANSIGQDFKIWISGFRFQDFGLPPTPKHIETVLLSNLYFSKT